MDALFTANVPDIPKGGSLKYKRLDVPIPHSYRTLEFIVAPRTPQYSRLVHDMALAIACARLNQNCLRLWQRAVMGTQKLSEVDRQAIAYALARGICHSGYAGPDKPPKCNDDNFKGHIVEVLLFCLRVYLHKMGNASPIIFVPGKPKANPASGGIDLLEIGETKGSYYFQLWECKGTDSSVTASLTQAAEQLCSPSGTAYQSFMEAYRCLLERDACKSDQPLKAFIGEMPRRFYGSPPHRSKRVGGVVGSGSDYTESCCHRFLERVNGLIINGHNNCQLVVIKIVNFPQFRKDVFSHLWNI
jgi:hypothetical protein